MGLNGPAYLFFYLKKRGAEDVLQFAQLCCSSQHFAYSINCSCRLVFSLISF